MTMGSTSDDPPPTGGPAAHERGLDFPPWVPQLTTGIVVVIAAISSLPAHGMRPHPVGIALVWLSIVPWVLDAVDVPLPRLAFGAGVMIPQAIIHVGGDALGIANLTDEGPLHMAAMIVVFAVGQVAATAGWRDSLLVAGAGAAALLGRTAVEPTFDAGVFWAAGAFMAFGIGYMMRRQAEIAFQLRAAQQALARDAVNQERQRIAREVHDVLAHSLTVTMMHVTAARMSARKDPGSVEAALEDAERLGREAVADLRRTVGLLRDGPASSGEPPQPDAADLERLVGDYRSAGLDITVDVEADLTDLRPSAGLAVYRIVQESLTNARKHAPGTAVHISIQHTDGVLDLQVRNRLPDPADRPAPTAREGMGLVGMRERASLLGGTLNAGPEGDGWLVRCRFPTAPSSTGSPNARSTQGSRP